MIVNNLVCWKCGASLAPLPLPLSRLAECPACRAYLHVCRMCQLWNPGISDQCNEPRAEHPHSQDRANFCDFFKPRADAHRRGGAKTQAAKAALDSFFGGAGNKPEPSSDTRGKLDDFFGKREK